MQITTTKCPKCQIKLSLPSEAKKVRCSNCQEVFAPAATGVESETRSLDPSATASFSATPETSKAPRDLHKIGRFEIRRELGEGAFGKVYEAYDPQLDRAVAIKVAKLGRGDSEQRVKRFLREAKSAAGLRHPHIVPVHEFGQEGDLFYIVATFIKGSTLQDSLKNAHNDKEQKPDLGRAARVVRQLAEALAYAHAQGIVHRDVKPANVMLDDKDEPMLMDFGLATRQEEAEKLTHAGAVLGTPLYMPPEQAQGQQGSALPASDQYSLGVMLYEMIAGQPPFKGTPELVMFHHMETEPPRPRKFNPNISRDLETICLKCLEKEPTKRYANNQAMADDLRRWQEGEAIHARRIGPIERMGRWCRRNPTVAILCLLVAVSMTLGTTISTHLALSESTARSAADESAREASDQALLAKASALKAQEQSKLAEDNELIAKAQTRLAEDNEKQAKEQTKLAEVNAIKAREETEKARRESAKATRVSGFLVGLFNAVDPVGLTGYAFGPDPNQGAKLTAKEVLDRGVRNIKVELKDQPETRAAVLMTVGSVLCNMGQYKDAKPLLEESLEIRKKLPKTIEKDIAECWFNLGRLHHMDGDFFEARRCYDEAIRLVENTPGSEDLVSQCRFGNAWLLSLLQMHNKAETMFREVLNERRKRLGDDHFDVAVAQTGLGTVLITRNKLQEGILMVVPALQTFRRTHGDESMGAAAGIVQSAFIDAGFGNIRGAEKKMLEATELAEKRLGKNHPFVAWSIGITAEMMLKTNQNKSAANYYAKCLQVCREGFGLDHPLVLLAIGPYAELLAEQGDEDGGRKLFEEFLEQVETRRGKNHHLLLRGYTAYASFALFIKNSKAEELARKAVDLSRKSPNVDYRIAVLSRNLLAACISKRVPDEAESLWREAIDLYTKTGEEAASDWETADIWSNYSRLLISQRRYSEAEPLLRKALQKRISNESRAALAPILKDIPTLRLEELRRHATLISQLSTPSWNSPLPSLCSNLVQFHGSIPVFDVINGKTLKTVEELSDQLNTECALDPVLKDSYCKKHTFTLEAGVDYQIDLRSTDFDAYLRIEDAQGKTLARDDDSGGNLNARILFTPTKTANLHVFATTYKKRATGVYILTLQRSVYTPAVTVRSTLLHVEDRLTVQDIRDARKSTYKKTYDVKLSAGVSYTIDMKSDVIDSYLILENESGRKLAEDDDGGGFPNARISFRAPSDGLYRIIATTFPANQTGPFLLSVQGKGGK